MFLSDFHPATCRWDVTLLTLVEGHFHRICLLRLLCLVSAATYYPWPFMKPVPACTCLWQLNISNFLPRFKSSQNCVMFLKKNYLLGINHKPNHMNHFRRFQQETALQPFKPAPLRSCRCPCGPRLDTQPSQNSVWKWMGFYSEFGTKWPEVEWEPKNRGWRTQSIQAHVFVVSENWILWKVAQTKHQQLLRFPNKTEYSLYHPDIPHTRKCLPDQAEVSNSLKDIFLYLLIFKWSSSDRFCRWHTWQCFHQGWQAEKLKEQKTPDSSLFKTC